MKKSSKVEKAHNLSNQKIWYLIGNPTLLQDFRLSAIVMKWLTKFSLSSCKAQVQVITNLMWTLIRIFSILWRISTMETKWKNLYKNLSYKEFIGQHRTYIESFHFEGHTSDFLLIQIFCSQHLRELQNWKNILEKKIILTRSKIHSRGNYRTRCIQYSKFPSSFSSLTLSVVKDRVREVD